MSDPYLGLVLDNSFEVISFFKDTTFGKVYHGKKCNSDQRVSVYFLSPKLVPGVKTLEFLESEVGKLRQMHHSSLIDILACSSVRVSHSSIQNFYMIESGRYAKTLKEFISGFSSDSYSSGDVFSILNSVLDAVLCMLEHDFVPQSLNPRIIEISETHNVKLPKFNYLSSLQWVRDHSHCSNISAIDLRYIAPEMIKSPSIYPAEVESLAYIFGVLAYELSTGVAPFEANRDTVLSMHLHDDPPTVLHDSQMPDWFKDMVYSCLSKEVSKRPSLHHIKNIFNENMIGGDFASILPPVRLSSNYKVLFVEDNRLDQLSFARHAKNEKYLFDYIIAHSVTKASQILKERSFDCIVSDYMLPDGTASDIIELAKPVPTIVVSGAGKETIALQVLREGAVEYIAKDIKHSHLYEIPKALEAVFKKRTSRHATYKILEHINSLYCMYQLEHSKNRIYSSLAELVSSVDSELQGYESIFSSTLENMDQYIESISEAMPQEHIEVEAWESIITELLNIQLQKSNKVFSLHSIIDLNELTFNYEVFLCLVFSSLIVASRSNSSSHKVSVKFSKSISPDTKKDRSKYLVVMDFSDSTESKVTIDEMTEQMEFYFAMLEMLCKKNKMSYHVNHSKVKHTLLSISMPLNEFPQVSLEDLQPLI